VQAEVIYTYCAAHNNGGGCGEIEHVVYAGDLITASKVSTDPIPQVLQNLRLYMGAG
jgi:hypothetical protein